MPGRYIRDGYLTSERVDALSLDAERFYFRLLLVVDDFGRYLANAAILRSMCFPLKGDISTGQISAWMNECAKAGLIVVYSADGKKYLAIERFGQRPRSRKSRYPEYESAKQCFAEEKQCFANAEQCSAMEKPVSQGKHCFAEEKQCFAMEKHPQTMFSLNDNDNDNDNGVCRVREGVRVPTREEGAEEGENAKDETHTQYQSNQSIVIPYPTKPEEVMAEAEKICYAMTREEAENFIAKNASCNWTARNGQPIRKWPTLLTIWKNNQRKEPSYAGNQRHDYKRVATDEEFRRTTHFDDPAEFLAPAARGIVEGQLPQGAGSEKH